jgi:hypothetical protein
LYSRSQLGYGSDYARFLRNFWAHEGPCQPPPRF